MLVSEGPQKPIPQSKGTPTHIAGVSTLPPCGFLKFCGFQKQDVKSVNAISLFFCKSKFIILYKLLFLNIFKIRFS
jgi:hypothetical protein